MGIGSRSENYLTVTCNLNNSLKAADLHPRKSCIRKWMQYRWLFFNVYANLNVNKVDKEHHTPMESCMEPPKAMLAYHDSFKRDRPAIIEP